MHNGINSIDSINSINTKKGTFDTFNKDSIASTIKPSAGISDVKLKVGDFRFRIENTALIMIDFQRDFLLPGGFGQLLGNDVKLLHSAIKPAKKVLNCARSVNMTIIHTLEA